MKYQIIDIVNEYSIIRADHLADHVSISSDMRVVRFYANMAILDGAITYDVDTDCYKSNKPC